MKDEIETIKEITKNWTYRKAFLKVILPLMILCFVIYVVSFFFNMAQQPMEIMKNTFNADNVVHNYEWFHDVDKHQKARVNQIIQFKVFFKSEDDKDEKIRLRMEMAAQQMSCRNLVAKYNANSEKMNVKIFKDWSLPDRINPNECE